MGIPKATKAEHSLQDSQKVLKRLTNQTFAW